MVSYLIDAFLAVMLVTATGYMVVVNRRLRVLRDGQSELGTLIKGFARDIDEADASVRRLVGSATEVAAVLGSSVERATEMKEEVGLLLGSCERTAARLDDSRRHAQQLLKRLDEGMATRPQRAAAPAVTPDPRASAEPGEDDAAAPAKVDGMAVASGAPSAAAEPPVTADMREKARAALMEALRSQVEAAAEEPREAAAMPFREISPADLAAAPRRPETENRLGVGEFYAALRTLPART
ncbi:DUF6468 domain-containing protein [Arenibaculum pallidiluteum]|uniref:DUF6468 domain-containing protein n=1 Tax=Arenibaculum pallidiluteum TaxID=2812559 RepID=UPI001A95934A|nr:DUF6468 domain-containing protein [Arenibaculum pallidiluteum]